MKFCTKCGNEIISGAKFCSVCGEKFVNNDANNKNLEIYKKSKQSDYTPKKRLIVISLTILTVAFLPVIIPVFFGAMPFIIFFVVFYFLYDQFQKK
tara:strand:+ start:267 stop:554 length:288 start_codon:yes stop_codon:yes gene_type:complete